MQAGDVIGRVFKKFLPLAAPFASAAAAERSKATKYTPRGGASMLGLALEWNGRHGPQLTSFLEQLASLHRAHECLRGRAARAPLLLWRTRLAILLGRAIAVLVSSACMPPVHP